MQKPFKRPNPSLGSVVSYLFSNHDRQPFCNSCNRKINKNHPRRVCERDWGGVVDLWPKRHRRHPLGPFLCSWAPSLSWFFVSVARKKNSTKESKKTFLKKYPGCNRWNKGRSFFILSNRIGLTLLFPFFIGQKSLCGGQLAKTSSPTQRSSIKP